MFVGESLESKLLLRAHDRHYHRKKGLFADSAGISKLNKIFADVPPMSFVVSYAIGKEFGFPQKLVGVESDFEILWKRSELKVAPPCEVIDALTQQELQIKNFCADSINNWLQSRRRRCQILSSDFMMGVDVSGENKTPLGGVCDEIAQSYHQWLCAENLFNEINPIDQIMMLRKVALYLVQRRMGFSRSLLIGALRRVPSYGLSRHTKDVLRARLPSNDHISVWELIADNVDIRQHCRSETPSITLLEPKWFQATCDSMLELVSNVYGVTRFNQSFSRICLTACFHNMCRNYANQCKTAKDLKNFLKEHITTDHVEAMTSDLVPKLIEIFGAALDKHVIQCIPVSHLGDIESSILALDPTFPCTMMKTNYPVTSTAGVWKKSTSEVTPYNVLRPKIVSAGPCGVEDIGNMKAVINYLASTAFTVNKYSLYVLQEHFRQGMKLDNIVAAYSSANDMDLSHLHRHNWFRELLREGAQLLKMERFYLPMKLDFRGRVYPLPSIMNHTASGQYRSLFLFADPVPLGATGLRWLQIHAANMYGHTKMTYDNRVLWIQENMDLIQQTVENPFGSTIDWWSVADSPFEFLSTCEELTRALRAPDPSQFLSHLPVQVDGTANGLQHYVAIARDEKGAVAVNMTNAEKPQDVYGHVLQSVIASVKSDAERGHIVACRALGSGTGQDRNHLKRSTVKRSVMTQVYGVTAYGMREQILDEFMSQNATHALWNMVEMQELADYIRDKVMQSLGEIFHQGDAARRWLRESATSLMSVQPKNHRKPLRWTTPLGMTVVQPYYQTRTAKLYDMDLGITSLKTTSDNASNKQITALSPNLIHSLDATHMAKTALEMRKRGHKMAAVHDSYWCHAGNMEEMSLCLREQFLDLYDKFDPLAHLSEEWNYHFHEFLTFNKKLKMVPSRGSYDLKAVLNAPYFFS
eukprot:PhF_6_TR1032/c0_g1_i1/m.2097/K10908/POLRMT, RPO41; DNA-directed RNA polymerase, mitochondrial